MIRLSLLDSWLAAARQSIKADMRASGRTVGPIKPASRQRPDGPVWERRLPLMPAVRDRNAGKRSAQNYEPVKLSLAFDSTSIASGWLASERTLILLG